MEPTVNGNVAGATEASRKRNGLLDWIKFLAGVLIVYLVVFNTIGITKVIGQSMDPTLKDGSFLFINKLSTFISEPSYGDVVIVQEEDMQIVKRVVGIPGDTVAIQEGVLYINDEPISENYVLGTSDDMTPVAVEKGEVFIMGDNRTPGKSFDSRDSEMGAIPVDRIQGYAVISLYPFYTIKKP